MSTSYSRSIRRKLILLFTATASITVLLACSSLWVYQLLNYRETLQTEERGTAQLIADSSAPALLFGDTSAANETLSTLRTDKRIRAACLYDKRGEVMAGFARPNVTLSCPPSKNIASRFTASQLTLARTIDVKGDVVGQLYLEVGLEEMYRLLTRLAATGLCVLLVATLFALGLSSILQRFISGPILDLTAVATKISRGSDTGIRARRISDDETGILVDQFNLMLDNIQQREAELWSAHNNLEEKVRERTRDLRDEIVERKAIEHDLEIAKLRAEESNVAKSSFLANMSHELRTPLNAIIGYSEMLHEDATDAGLEAFTDDLDKVLLSAHHLLSLISEILDFSKIEAGEMKIYPELVASCTVLNELMSTAQVLVKKNRNQLVKVEPSWQGAMVIDPLRFRQCLLNLIGNACKFTEDGTVSVSVVRRDTEEGAWIEWSVRDTGVGISVEEQKTLFQTFSQGDSSATRKHGGSGLGLAISRQLCIAMGGHIKVESTVNVGSTFTICMPDRASLSDDEATPQLDASTSVQHREGKKIFANM